MKLTFNTWDKEYAFYMDIEINYFTVSPLGCDPTRYSSGCKQICPSKCKNSHCDAFNGSCIHGCSNPNAQTLNCLGKMGVSIILY